MGSPGQPHSQQNNGTVLYKSHFWSHFAVIGFTTLPNFTTLVGYTPVVGIYFLQYLTLSASLTRFLGGKTNHTHLDPSSTYNNLEVISTGINRLYHRCLHKTPWDEWFVQKLNHIHPYHTDLSTYMTCITFCKITITSQHITLHHTACVSIYIYIHRSVCTYWFNTSQYLTWIHGQGLGCGGMRSPGLLDLSRIVGGIHQFFRDLPGARRCLPMSSIYLSIYLSNLI